MKIRDTDGWREWVENNQDPYGKAVIEYSERWADLMEIELEQGKELVEIAKDASHEANTEGLTGFMYGAAVSVLATVWEHGEELRRWHNLDTQIKNEGERANESGGVLNPAILCLGSKQD